MATKEIRVPDIGDFKGVEIIEVLVKPGDTIQKEQPVIALESEKATMEVPASDAGTVKELKVKIGDKVSQGDLILVIESAAEDKPAEPAPVKEEIKPAPAPQAAPPPPKTESKEAEKSPTPSAPPVTAAIQVSATPGAAHASPSIRLFARELGVDLSKVTGTGPKGRVLREDVQKFVKGVMTTVAAAPVAQVAATGGSGLPRMPVVDFSKFGPIENKPLSRIRKLSATYLHRSWVLVPHVTQFDDADITDLDKFRKESSEEARKKGIKLTMLSFLLKASATTLLEFPELNSSLSPEGDALILKKYVNVGIAVDTPDGLVVPVVRDVDKKGIFQLAKELSELSEKARIGKLSATDMQGGCFSISSLGGIGGTKFTPIVNAPEVGILGVSKSQIRPVWDGKEFMPRLILPLSLSYDHRVIDGAQAARITTYLGELLGDIRRLLL